MMNDDDTKLDTQHGEVREPKTFDASDASAVVGSVTVEFKKRPFGVLAYASWHDRTESCRT